MWIVGSRVRPGTGQALGESICKHREKGKGEPVGNALCPATGNPAGKEAAGRRGVGERLIFGEGGAPLLG